MTIPRRLELIDITDRAQQSPIYSPEVQQPFAAATFSRGELQPSASEVEESQFIEGALRSHYDQEYVKAERKRLFRALFWALLFDAMVGTVVAIVRRVLR